jgi:opacity protein-like surface antigen
MSRAAVLLIFSAAAICSAQEAQKFTLEALGGVSLPMGSAKDQMKMGYNVLIGAGWRFTPHIAALMEFQLDRFSVTSSTLKAYNQPAGFNRFGSLSLSPRYSVRPAKKLGAYGTAGFGIYGRELAFTDPSQIQTYCDPYNGQGCQSSSAPIVFSHTNYKGGMDVGGGVTYAPTGNRFKLVTDVRYNRFLSHANNEFVTVSLGFSY